MLQITKIEIQNYRSIDHLELTIPNLDGKNCLFFFGINETGKSNLLKAISLLDKNNLASKNFNYEKDCEKAAKKRGDPVEIKYFFNILPDLEIANKLVPKMPENFLPITKIQIIKTITYANNANRQEKYSVLYPNQINFEKYVLNNKDGFITERKDVLSDYKLLDENLLNETLLGYLGNLDTLLPPLVFWKSSPEYLINQPIDLNNFKSNPNVSVPLKNMFLLIDLKDENLKKNIDRLLANSDDRDEMERELSQKITDHINMVWPEHKIDINVRIESGQCHIFVSDKGSNTKFRMEDRSDGFKQFISILLTLSVENRKEALKNNIILLDEPEVSLHPSSVRYLRNELLNISKNNIVIAASHSVFLVDKNKLERHYIVKKEGGHTKISAVDPQNPFEDEIIYEALGTSIYEFIAQNFVVFEGGEDKKLFDLFTNKFSVDFATKKIKTASANGANGVVRYTKFFPDQLVKGFFVLDSDEQGENAKRAIIKLDSKLKSFTFELTDLAPELIRGSTLEDLLPCELILDEASNFYKIKVPNDPTKPILKSIKESKDAANVKMDFDLKELKAHILARVIEDLNTKSDQDIRKYYSKYLDFIKNLHSKISE
jgi:predicted ATP-dependent endonuclease of OLD family